MTIFGGLDNCFVQAKYSVGQGRGAKISFESGGGLDDNTIVTDFRVRNAEKFASVPCFNDRNHIYSFGHDAQNSVGSVTVLTNIEMPEGDTTGFKTAIKSYKSNRLSAGKRMAVSVGGVVFIGRLVGMETSTSKLELNLQSITYTFIIPEP